MSRRSPAVAPARLPAPTVVVAARRGFGSHAAGVRRDARRVLGWLGEGGSELSVALVADDEMQLLNASFRGKDRPTDVLAFAQREGDAVIESGLLGDVVISVPTAERQARRRGHSVEAEIRILLVHGVLHLLGFDHEVSPGEARRMFRRQRELVAELGRAEGARRGCRTAGSRDRSRDGA